VNSLSLPPHNEPGAGIKFNHPNPEFASKYAGKQLFYQIIKITEMKQTSLAWKWEDP
jgi:hypothetical protein